MPTKFTLISTKLFAAAFVLLASVILFSPKTYAVVRTWDGGGGADTNWLTCANWSDDGCPGGGDIATFDGTSTGDVTINGTFSVGGVDINSGYSGTITMGSNIIFTVGNSNFDIASGTFTGVSSSTLDTTGDVVISGGTFNAPGNIKVGDDWTHSAGGVFNHNNGLVTFYTAQDTLVDGTSGIASSLLFYDFTVGKSSNWLVQLATSDVMTVEGTLTLSDGRFNTQTLNSGRADLKGNMVVASTIDGTATNVRFIGSGTQTIDLTGATALFDGDVLLEGSGTLRLLTDLTMNASGQDIMIDSGTFDPNGMNVSVEGNFQLNGGEYMSSGTLDVNGNVTIAGGTFNAPPTINVADDWTHTSGGVFNNLSGTVIFDGGKNTVIDGTGGVASSIVFYNLTIQKASGWEVRVQNGDTVVATNNLNFTDGRVIGGDTASNLEARGNVTVASTLDDSTVHLKFKAGNDQNFDLTGGVGLFNGKITIDKTVGTVTLLSDLTMDAAQQNLTVIAGALNASSRSLRCNDFSITGGTFTGGNLLDIDNSFTMSGGTFNAPAIVTIANDWTHTTGGTFNHQNGTVTFENALDSRINVDSISSAGVFYGLRMFKASGYLMDIATGDVVVVEGQLRLSDGRFSQQTVNSGYIDARGDVLIESGVDLTTNVFLKFTGSANQALSSSGTSAAESIFDGDITVAKTGGTLTLETALTLNALNQDLMIDGGTFDIAGNNLTVNGTSGKFSVASGANFQLQGGETLTLNSGNPTLNFGSNVTYTGSSSYTIKDYTYSNLRVNNPTGTFSLPSAKTIKDLTISAGTLSLSGQSFSATGSFSNDGTLRLQGAETLSITMDNNSGTTEYVGNANGSANPFVVKDLNYYNLRIDLADSDDSVSHADSSLDVEGRFTMNAGIFTAPSAMNVAGDFEKLGGTLNHNNGTVTLDGSNQAINGALTFYNLTKNVSSAATLTFPSGTTTTVNGTTDLRGASGQRLSIRSSGSGTVATLDSQGTKTLQYLDVKDSTAIQGMVCLTSCLNSGNNTKWYFETSVSIAQTSASTNVTEGGATDTYDIVLTAPPSSNVTVNITGGGSQVTTSTGTVVFTTVNWETPQTITVTAVNDDVAEGSHVRTINHASASSDANYNALTIASVAVNITDNDTAGFTIGLISGDTSEAGSGATFTVVLTSMPTANVTIPYSSSDSTEATVSGTGLTFTTLNWNQAQTINVTGVNDDLDDGDIAYSVLLSATSSGDSNYNNVNPPDVSVSNVDDDVSGVTFSESSLALTEGSVSGTYTIVLTAEPTADVTILLSPDAQAAVSSTGVVFTSADWDAPQTVTVTPTDDSTVEGTHSGELTHDIDSSDLIYNALILNSLAYTITDNDLPAGDQGGGGGGGGGGGRRTRDDDSGGGSSGGSDDDEVAVDESEHPFVDTIGHWAEPAVLNLFERDIVKGKKPGIYGPNDDITRAEFLKIVILNAGYQISDFSGASFRDVDERDWYYDYVSFAEFSGFIRGYSDGTFRPNAPINRAEAVSILMTIAKQGVTNYRESDVKFHDVSLNDWYTHAVVNASKNGIVQGYGDGSFRPAANMTRGEMAVVAKRAFDIYFD